MNDDNISLKRQPIFNVPRFVLVFLVVIVGIHFLRAQVLDRQSDLLWIVNFSFIPLRFSEDGSLSTWFTLLSYSLLHGSWSHVIVNAVWLLVFGSVVAKRLGFVRVLLFSLICSLAGAFAHYLSFPQSPVPMLGASAVISGYMGASVRFAFPRHGNFSPERFQAPSAPLFESLKNPRVFAFVAVWFAINLVFGLGGEAFAGPGQSIAWQAHLGGFLAGLLLFRFVDPIRHDTYGDQFNNLR